MVRHVRRRAFLAFGAVAFGSVAGLTGLARARSRQQLADQQLKLGELTLSLTANPMRLSLIGPRGELLWTEPDDQPLSYVTAAGQTVQATRLNSVATLGDGVTQLLVATDDPAGSTLTIELKQLGQRQFRMTIVPDARTPVASLSGALTLTDDERFVGFGERFDSLDQRGKVVDVWAEDRRVAGYGPSTYAPLPIVLSSRGHSFTLERFERARFDLAASRDDRWTWQQDAPAASIVVAYGPSLKELVQRTAELSGLPPLPPVWLFGVWKTSVGGQTAVLDELRRLRDLHVPLSAVFAYDAVDAEANLGWPSVSFGGRSPGPYPDHRAFTDALHDQGFKALNYFTADFHLDRPNYAEPASHGFLVHRDDGRVYLHPDFQVGWLDFTDPDASVWWGASWRRGLNTLGYDGGMLDLGELIPADAVMADGTSGRTTHNRYPLLYAQSAWQQALAARPDGDFALVLRSGALGAQRFQSAQWNGDAVMRWPAPDGLRSMIPAALSFGLCGFPYWHAEVAGYVQVDLSHADERELWLRWVQFAAWTSLLRDHLGDHPRNPIEVWTDQGTLDGFRAAARVHASLTPYLYSLAVEASQTGLPLMRPMALEVPDDARAWQEDQSFFLGPTFLVAPVVEPGATTRTVYLPAGEWVDYWRGTVYQGGREVTVPAPLDAEGAPVFARAGAIVPLAADHDTLIPATSPGVRTWTGDLVVRVMPAGSTPSAASSFDLYDGTQLGWNGSTLSIEANPRPRSVELRLPDGSVFTRQVTGPSASIP